MRKLIATLVFALLLSGCSQQKIISPRDLRSQLTAAISLASESETFLDYLSQHRSSGNFAAGHLVYLSQTAADTAKELHQSRPTYSVQQQFTQARQQLDALASQLAHLQQEVAAGQTPSPSKDQLDEIRHSLEQIKAGI